MAAFIELHAIRIDAQYNLLAPTPFSVNLDHITSFRADTTKYSSGLSVSGTLVEYIGDAGYHTRKTMCSETYDKVKELIHLARFGLPRPRHVCGKGKKL